MKQYDALIFDFDGVLVDSVHVKTTAFAALYHSYGAEVEAKVVAHHLHYGGMSRYDKFRHYHAEYLGTPLDDDGVMTLAEAFAQQVVDQVVAAPEIPGADAFLQWHARRQLCFVNSATPEQELRQIIQRRNWEHHFTQILGAPRSKADNLHLILEQYRFDARRCLFFGDAFSDFTAAQTHHVPFIGVVSNSDAPLLKKAPHIDWKPDFTAIDAWIRNG